MKALLDYPHPTFGNRWLPIERFYEGFISRPHHGQSGLLVDLNGEEVHMLATSDQISQLGNYDENDLVSINYACLMHIDTFEVRDLVMIDLEKVSKADFYARNLVTLPPGTLANEIPDPAKWVRELRGYGEEE